MAGQRSSFGKLQRDRDKKAKAAAKRTRRQDGADDSASTEADASPAAVNGRQLSTAELLERIAEIHQQFDAGTISYELFEETKADLMGRLAVD